MVKKKKKKKMTGTGGEAIVANWVLLLVAKSFGL